MKIFIMIASAVVLFSATASAEEVVIRCSDNVQRGTLKLSNPPTMNCDDFNLVKGYVGSGISVGPNSRVAEIVSAIESIQPAPSAQPVTEVTEVKDDLDDFTNENFIGMKRNDEWFNSEPIRTPRFEKWLNKDTTTTSRSTNSDCNGWVNINDIMSGKCASVQVKLNK